MFGEFVDFEGGGLIVDFVLFEDAFFNEMLVCVIDHAFGEKGSWKLLVKVDGVSLHEQVGCLLTKTFRDENSDSVGKAVFGGIDVEVCADQFNFMCWKGMVICGGIGWSGSVHLGMLGCFRFLQNGVNLADEI